MNQQNDYPLLHKADLAIANFEAAKASGNAQRIANARAVMHGVKAQLERLTGEAKALALIEKALASPKSYGSLGISR